MADRKPRQILEALVRGDMEAYRSLAGALDAQGDQETRSLIQTALVIEANARWDEATDVAEIRSWVANLRNHVERDIGDVNPISCEKIIVGAVTGDPTKMAGVPRGEVTNLVSLITFALAQDAAMSDEQIHELLDQAEELNAG